MKETERMKERAMEKRDQKKEREKEERETEMYKYGIKEKEWNEKRKSRGLIEEVVKRKRASHRVEEIL